MLDPVTCTGQYLIAGGLVAVDGASAESSLNGGVTSKKVDAAMLTSVIMTAEDIASSILLFYHVGMWILSPGGIFGILGLLVAGVVLYQLLSLSMMCYIENVNLFESYYEDGNMAAGQMLVLGSTIDAVVSICCWGAGLGIDAALTQKARKELVGYVGETNAKALLKDVKNPAELMDCISLE